MLACYDLNRCPPTYDVVAFLALAEAERLRRGDPDLQLAVLPGPRGGFRIDALWPRLIEQRVLLRNNVLLPICRLLPSVTGDVLAYDSRPLFTRGAWGDNSYYVGLPAILSALKLGSRPLRGPVAEKGKPYVTITLREAEHHVKRNSNVDAWIVAALSIKEMGYDVIFIRDTVKSDEPLPGFPIEPSASKSIKHRARVYQNAALNMGISNGPLWLAIFMDVPVLMLRPTTNEASGCYDDRFYAKCGLPRGFQLPTSPAYQRLVWETDSKENILTAFREMLPCLK